MYYGDMVVKMGDVFVKNISCFLTLKEHFNRFNSV